MVELILIATCVHSNLTVCFHNRVKFAIRKACFGVYHLDMGLNPQFAMYFWENLRKLLESVSSYVKGEKNLPHKTGKVQKEWIYIVYWWKHSRYQINGGCWYYWYHFIVMANGDSFLYFKEYSLENHFREPLNKGEDHCWLLWVLDKGDKLSDRKANA